MEGKCSAAITCRTMELRPSLPVFTACVLLWGLPVALRHPPLSTASRFYGADPSVTSSFASGLRVSKVGVSIIQVVRLNADFKETTVSHSPVCVYCLHVCHPGCRTYCKG